MDFLGTFPHFLRPVSFRKRFVAADFFVTKWSEDKLPAIPSTRGRWESRIPAHQPRSCSSPSEPFFQFFIKKRTFFENVVHHFPFIFSRIYKFVNFFSKNLKLYPILQMNLLFFILWKFFSFSNFWRTIGSADWLENAPDWNSWIFLGHFHTFWGLLVSAKDLLLLIFFKENDQKTYFRLSQAREVAGKAWYRYTNREGAPRHLSHFSNFS